MEVRARSDARAERAPAAGGADRRPHAFAEYAPDVDEAEALEQQLSRLATERGCTFVVEELDDDLCRATFKQGGTVLKSANHGNRVEALRALKGMVEKDSQRR
jgi:predicted nucleic acid-binding Zn ribbon protein